jgi:hypothetical protein
MLRLAVTHRALRLCSQPRAALRPVAAAAHAPAAAMAATPKLRLTYFNIKARGEPTRLALHIGGVPFEDVRIAHGDFAAMKDQTPFGQIPGARPAPCARLPRLAPARSAVRTACVACASRTRGGIRSNQLTRADALRARRAVLEVDGVQLAQSYAILMYAGRLAKLVPEDALGAAKVGAPRGASRLHARACG